MRYLMTALILLLCLHPQEQQQAPAEKPAEKPPAEIPDPVNLHILDLSTGKEVEQVMRTFTAGLGVECSFCHLEGDYASDEKEAKQTARRMLRLIQKINADFNDGKMHVSCYTCHRGETQPKTAPMPSPAQ